MDMYLYSQLVEARQHGEDLAGQRLDAVLAEVPAKQERISFRLSTKVISFSQSRNNLMELTHGRWGRREEQRDARAGRTHGG